MVVAGAGVVLAAYLTWVHYDISALVCRVGDCHTVQASQYAMVGAAPVALLGAGMYAAVLATQIVARVRPHVAFAMSAVAFAIALAGTLYAAYLTWLEVAVIHAICQWCVASAVLTVTLLALTSAMIWRMFASSGADDETGVPRAASW